MLTILREIKTVAHEIGEVMSGEDDQRFNRLLDNILKLAIPILFASVGFTFSQILELNDRVTVIETSRYTAADAEKDREALRTEIRVFASNAPPQWFKDQVAELARIAKANTMLLQEIDKRMVRLESK